MASENVLQTFREVLTPILLKLFKKNAEEGILVNSFSEDTITLIPKLDKDITKKENIPDEHRQNIIKYQIQQH